MKTSWYRKTRDLEERNALLRMVVFDHQAAEGYPAKYDAEDYVNAVAALQPDEVIE